jgi:thiol reductant ABC exporter CydD subunit
VKGAERRLLGSVGPARLHLALTVGLGLGSAAATVVAAALVAALVAGAFEGGAGPHGAALAVLAATLAVRALAVALTEVSGRAAAARSLSQLRRRVVEHVLLDRAGAPGRAPSGDLATAAVQGVDALEAWFARYLPQVVLSVLVPPLLLAYLLSRDATAAIVLALTVPLVPLFMVLVGLASRSAAQRRFSTLSTLGAHFVDVVHGLPTLRAFRREAAQVAQIAAVTDRWRQESMRTLRVAFLSALVLELIAMLGTAVAAGVVGLQLVSGSLGLEAGLTVLILAPELYAPLRALGTQYHASADGLAAAERLFALLDEPPARAPAAGAGPAPARARAPGSAPDPARHAVRIEGARVTHPGAANAVLAGVDLELAPGATTALTGPSGAGKSTLAALVLRLADPTEGRLTCAGVDLRQVAPEDWWRQVAWMPQATRLYAGALADNVRLGAPGVADPAVSAALEAVGLGPLLDGLPEGLRTRVGDGGRGLSAGEARRVALARALVRDAPLVILDEPTAHLDADAAAVVRRAVARVCRGRTALVVTHDPALAASADRRASLVDGRVAVPAPAVAA